MSLRRSVGVPTEHDVRTSGSSEVHPSGVASLRGQDSEQTTGQRAQTAQILKEFIIPEIEREVNTGKNFASLRQVYHSLILATWYKETLKTSLLNKVYANQNKINGINVSDKNVKEKIYRQYLEAFRKGVYDFIKEDYDPYRQELIPRKYFSIYY